MHQNFPAIDNLVRQWMLKQGLGVTDTNYNFDRELLAWRHAEKGQPSVTLRIGRPVLEAWGGHGQVGIVSSSLDGLGTAELLRANHNVLVFRDSDGAIRARAESFE